jgi:glycosyltransferase involved in cell wall biosynthesis
MLAVVETHPIQYHAPVYRALEQRHGVPVTAIYGSDFSVKGYRDREFGAEFAWDTDLLGGYTSRFLSRVGEHGAASHDRVNTRGLGDALKAVAPSAVLLVGYSPRFHRSAWFEAWRGGYPLLFRGEASDDARRRSAARDAVRHAALSMAYRTCQRCLYIGERSRQHLLRHGVPPDRLTFSPYCVDTTPFEPDEAARARWRPSTRDRLGIAGDQVAVLFSGKLSERKGVDLIFEALARLPAEAQARFVIVLLGDGELRVELERLAARSTAVKAHFVGFQNQRSLSRFYHAADLLALPSRHSETWGLVVNEALHHGLPVVVSDRVGCAPDLVVPDRTGVVCPADSAEALAEALQRARPLVGRTAVRDACRSHVAAYSVDAAAAGLADAYRAVTDRAGEAA